MLKVGEIELMEVYEESGCNAAEAARKLGMDGDSLRKRIAGIKARRALKGDIPEMHIDSKLPEFLKVKGTSQLFKQGQAEPVLSWVKTTTDQEKLYQMMQEAIQALGEDLPRVSLMSPPPAGNANLMNCYVITDYHLGALSWHEETGADWDIHIAEAMLLDWFKMAIALAPDSETAVFAQLSDFLHFDGMIAQTPESKHPLDTDTRFAKLVRASIRVLRRVIDMLLSKHQKVHCIFADANHDPVSQIWLREWFSVLYENEPRITVDNSPSPYNAYEFGATSLFFHHGHKRRVSEVTEVFAAKFREMFGRTKYSYAHMGHMHHLDIKENNLMIVEQHRTLAAPDAYASRGGWMAGRDAQVITYHNQYGEVSRIKINSDMLK